MVDGDAHEDDSPLMYSIKVFSKRKLTQKIRSWPSKVSRYLAYCVDGGLLQSRCTLQFLVKVSTKIEHEEREQLSQ